MAASLTAMPSPVAATGRLISGNPN